MPENPAMSYPLWTPAFVLVGDILLSNGSRGKVSIDKNSRDFTAREFRGLCKELYILVFISEIGILLYAELYGVLFISTP